MRHLNDVMRLRRPDANRTHSALRSPSAARSALGVVLLLIVANGRAESMLQSGNSPAKASAHLDFRIVIPEMLMVDTATGAMLTNARATGMVVISTEAQGIRRTSTSMADRVSLRHAAINALGSSAAGPVSYTVTMP